jgi:hypothetical protein
MIHNVAFDDNSESEELIVRIIGDCWGRLDRKTRTKRDLAEMSQRVLTMANAGFVEPTMLRAAAMFKN